MFKTDLLVTQVRHHILIVKKMIKKTLNTGVIPNNWKTAHVPIYKKDPKYYSESNRLYSLT
jgi:hypothetical protein